MRNKAEEALKAIEERSKVIVDEIRTHFELITKNSAIDAGLEGTLLHLMISCGAHEMLPESEEKEEQLLQLKQLISFLKGQLLAAQLDEEHD